MPRPDVEPYDALLLVSFGGPEKPDDVMPFLANVTRRQDIPDARLEEVGEHYYEFGGRSPINDQNRAFIAAIEDDLAANGVDLPVYWGNRNWDPYLREALEQMRADGITRAAVLLTSAYSSYSGCRQYRENLADAVRRGPRTRPGSTGCATTSTTPASSSRWSTRPSPRWPSCRTTPAAAPTCLRHALDPGQHERRQRAARRRVRRAAPRSSPPRSSSGSARRPGTATRPSSSSARGPARRRCPWLEPDINDHLEDCSSKAVPGVVVVPIGFVSDHMEVIYDLDTEASATAEKLGPAVRARRHRRGRPALRRDGPRPAASSGRPRSGASRPSGPRSAPTRARTCARPAAAPTRAARVRRCAAQD